MAPDLTSAGRTPPDRDRLLSHGVAQQLPFGNRRESGHRSLPARRRVGRREDPAECTSCMWPATSRRSPRPTPPTSSSTTRRRTRSTSRCGAAATAPGPTSPPSEFGDEVAGAGQGPHRRRHRGRRPGRGHEQDPLRVDGRRLRALHRRRGRRADLRDLERRAGRVDPLRLRRARHLRRDRRPRGHRRVGHAASCPTLDARVAVRRRRARRADRARARTSTTTRSTERRTAVDARRPRLDHLHLRHDRPAQGLRAHAPQLRVRGARAAGPAVGLLQRRARRRCCSCRSRTCSAAPSRSARWSPAAPSATPPTSRTCVEDLGGFKPTFVLAVPRVFEKVYNTAKQKAHGDGKGRSSTTPRRSPSTTREALDEQRLARRCRSSCSTRSSTGSSTPSCGPRSAATASRRSPAARRWAPGSATSSAASASRSTRATA